MNCHTPFGWTRLAFAPALCALGLQAGEAPVNRLQALIDQAAPDAEVIVPRGTYEAPIAIAKPLRLRGEAGSECVLQVTADEPAIRVATPQGVVLEALTIVWQRATSNRPSEALAALALRDSSVTLKDVRFRAPGNSQRCPCAVAAQGFSDLKVERCQFDGYEYTLQFSEGAKGRVSDTVVARPGHCGITVGPSCEVEVVRCLVTGSGFHGLRNTGGLLTAKDNLVINNQNRGFYLGNRSARGSIRNNVIQGNATGISGFARSEVEVANNVIANSEYAGLDARDTCRLRIHHNLFLNNTRGLVLFEESGKNENTLGANLAWGNPSDCENFDPVPELVRVDPALKDPANGDFRPTDPATVKGHGLSDPAPFKDLWGRWKALQIPAK